MLNHIGLRVLYERTITLDVGLFRLLPRFHFSLDSLVMVPALYTQHLNQCTGGRLGMMHSRLEKKCN